MPISAHIAEPARPATMSAVSTGPSSMTSDRDTAERLLSVRPPIRPRALDVGRDLVLGRDADLAGAQVDDAANVTVTVAANQLPEPIDPNIDPNNPEFPGQEFTPGPNGGYKITVDEDQPLKGQVKGTDKDG